MLAIVARDEGLGWDPLSPKTLKILVVTITGKGDNPTFNSTIQNNIPCKGG